MANSFGGDEYDGDDWEVINPLRIDNQKASQGNTFSVGHFIDAHFIHHFLKLTHFYRFRSRKSNICTNANVGEFDTISFSFNIHENKSSINIPFSDFIYSNEKRADLVKSGIREKESNKGNVEENNNNW